MHTAKRLYATPSPLIYSADDDDDPHTRGSGSAIGLLCKSGYMPRECSMYISSKAQTKSCIAQPAKTANARERERRNGPREAGDSNKGFWGSLFFLQLRTLFEPFNFIYRKHILIIKFFPAKVSSFYSLAHDHDTTLWSLIAQTYFSYQLQQLKSNLKKKPSLYTTCHVLGCPVVCCVSLVHQRAYSTCKPFEAEAASTRARQSPVGERCKWALHQPAQRSWGND